MILEHLYILQFSLKFISFTQPLILERCVQLPPRYLILSSIKQRGKSSFRIRLFIASKWSLTLIFPCMFPSQKQLLTRVEKVDHFIFCRSLCTPTFLKEINTNDNILLKTSRWFIRIWNLFGNGGNRTEDHRNFSILNMGSAAKDEKREGGTEDGISGGWCWSAAIRGTHLVHDLIEPFVAFEEAYFFENF